MKLSRDGAEGGGRRRDAEEEDGDVGEEGREEEWWIPLLTFSVSISTTTGLRCNCHKKLKCIL
jgi:hypothetical protein